MICMKLSTRASSSFLYVCSLERNAGKVYLCGLAVIRGVKENGVISQGTERCLASSFATVAKKTQSGI